MKKKLDEIRGYVQENKKKIGITFLSLLGLSVIATGVWYSQSQRKANELTEMTISKVKEVKEVKQEESSPKKEEAKKTEQKEKKEAKDKNKKEETRSEAKGSTVVIESEAKKDTKEEAKEKKQTKVETREENKQPKESVVTKVTPIKKEETKPVKTNTTATTQMQPVTKPAETKSNTPASKREEPKKDPNEGKVWREAEYRTIQVPAVTEKRWIVDETAWTEQVDTGRGRIVHSDGFATENYAEADEYQKKKALEGKMLSYWVEPVYESVYHEEKGHWEDVIITPATTRQELVREAGWY